MEGERMINKDMGSELKNQGIGNLVAKLRAQSGLSMAQLSVRVGINPIYLSQVERGVRLPSDDIIRNLAEFFKLDENDLFDMAGRVPLAVREELEKQSMLQNLLKEMAKVKLDEQKKQEIYQEFIKSFQRIAFST
jgi:transcriptional regulator with XRE-family HTH domain